MNIEEQLKKAYKSLYDDKNPQLALKEYDDILKQIPKDINALVYKAACLEKLYFGYSDWHNDETIENANSILDLALRFALELNDRAAIGFVYFRFFVHYFNRKDYLKCQKVLENAKTYGYNDPTLPMWESRLEKKLRKVKKTEDIQVTTSPGGADKEEHITNTDTTSEAIVPTVKKLRTDWYQSANAVTISFFTQNLPDLPDDIKITITKNKILDLSYDIGSTGSEFQFNIKLYGEVDPTSVKVKLFSKKFEISINKRTKEQWKSLEYTDQQPKASDFPTSTKPSADMKLQYPSSSKKSIDWSKLNLDDQDEEEGSGSADAFFQKLYEGADPDTKRAMMKSFIESNGTSLNTNWDDVKQGEVKTAPPEGTELKKW